MQGSHPEEPETRRAMINTKCPQCSAKFFVAENLVAGKVVRFRCRKCGGTITVDGTKAQAGDREVEQGADSALLSRVPPAPAEHAQAKVVPAPVPPPTAQPREPKPTLRPIVAGAPVPAGTLQNLASAAVTPPEPTLSSEPTRQVDNPQAVDDGEPTAIAVPAANPKPATSSAQPARNPEPAVSTAPHGGTPTPGTASAKPAPAKPQATPSTPKAVSDEEPPVSSRARLARISMELQNSVFSVPEDEGVDVPVDVDDAPAYEELEPEPASLRGDAAMKPIAARPAPPKPPTPKPPAVRPPPPKPGAPRTESPKPGPVKVELPPPRGDAAGPTRPSPRAPIAPVDEDRVDFSAVGRASVEPTSLPSSDIFAPPIVPTAPDDAPAPESPPSGRPFAPAAPVAPLPPALAQPPAPAPAQGSPSRTGVYVAIAVVAVAIVGGGVYAFRGSNSGAATAPTRTVASHEADETPPAAVRPVNPAADTAAVPGTDAAAAAPPAAEPTTVSTDTKPAETVAKGPAPAASAKATTTAGPSATPTAETKPPATSGQPPKPAETKPAEPAPPPTPPSPGGSDAPFDKAAASTAMGSARSAAMSCKQEGGPQGNATVRVTFAPNGRSTNAVIDGPPFAGTPVGGCIASKFRGLQIPPFGGSPVTVRITVPIF